MTADNPSNTSNPWASEPPAPPATAWDVPIPPRFWWLKRITIGSLALLAILVVIRMGWGYAVDRRIRNQIETWRAEGRKVTIEDFDRALDEVPDERNAALLYERAIAELVRTSSNRVFLADIQDDPEKFPPDGPDARELIEKNSVTASWIEAAERLPETAWSHRLHDYTMNNSNSAYSDKRLLASFLQLATMHAHATGDDEEAIVNLNSLIHYSERIGGFPVLNNQLNAWVESQIAFDWISNYGSKLRIAHSNLDLAPGERPADPLMVRQVIARLIDEEAARRQLIEAFQADAALAFRFTSPRSTLSMWPGMYAPRASLEGVVRTVLSPANRSAAFRPLVIFRHYDLESNYTKTLQPIEEAFRTTESLPATIMNSTWNDLFSTYQGVLGSFIGFIADRRMAATALAIRLYELDYGQRPVSLEDLVPNYLPAVPLDPMCPHDSLLKFDSNRAILYSVGENGIDDSAVNTPVDARSCVCPLDIIFYLNGRKNSP